MHNHPIKKQADDMPRHALATMKATLDLCEIFFPNSERADLRNVFVDSYFKEQEPQA